MATKVYNDMARYLRRQVEFRFSYQIPAAPTTTPATVIRDGQGAQVASVSAIVSSVQTITFKTAAQSPGMTWPRQLTYASVALHVLGLATSDVRANVVANSYNPVTGTIQVIYRTGGGVLVAAPGVGDWVHMMLAGPDVDQFKDPA